MNILLFGAPGAGKGTQSALLVAELGMHHISTGDLFRNSIKNKTKLGLEAKTFIDRGELVPDSLTVGMVEEALGAARNENFILDGFPRNVDQAMSLEKLLKGMGLELGRAIFIDVPREQLMGRLTGRRVCKACGAVYHVEANPPGADGVCGACGKGPIYQRDDDKPEAITTRLDVYEKSTLPVVEFYKRQGKARSVDGTGDPRDVFARVSSEVKS